MEFAEVVLTKRENSRKLKVSGRGSWVVTCRMWKDKARITSGWEAFVLDNKLSAFDVVAVERNTKFPSTWNITIFKSSHGRTRTSICIQ